MTQEFSKSSTWLTRAVILTRPDGTEVEYPSQSAAARAEGFRQSPISEMCRGAKKGYRGYKARWKVDPYRAADTSPAPHVQPPTAGLQLVPPLPPPCEGAEGQ